MVWSDIAANLALARTWLNDIPDTDVQDASVEREHLVRPQILGFPSNRTYSGFQQVFRQTFGLGGTEALTPQEWVSKMDRLTIRPEAVNGVSSRWLLPLGTTMFLPYQSDLSVLFSCDLQARTDPVAGPFYPDGAGAGQIAGSFRFLVYDRQTLVSTERALRVLYPTEPAIIGPFGGLTTDRIHMLTTFTLDPGHYDIGMAYYEPAPVVEQFDLTRITFHIEAM